MLFKPSANRGYIPFPVPNPAIPAPFPLAPLLHVPYSASRSACQGAKGAFGSGNVYRWNKKAMEGWLCPALLKYFEQAPVELHI